jgi:hypothetical protein
MKIYHISQEYRFISEEDDNSSEQMESAWNVFRNNEIRPNRNKDITNIALDDGTVIGAVASGWDMGDNIATFSFDIAIDKSKQGMQIGTNLVRQTLGKYNSEKSDYREMGYKTEIELEAVNIKFGEFLVRQFGFEVIKRMPDRLLLRKE